MPNQWVWLWLIAAAILSSLPILLVKVYIDPTFLAKGIFAYLWAVIIFVLLIEFMLIFIYINLLKPSDSNEQPSIGIINTSFRVMGVIFIVLVGIFLFHEHLTRYQIIGVILAILALIFLS